LNMQHDGSNEMGRANGRLREGGKEERIARGRDEQQREDIASEAAHV
jgi:hypothetical protein